LAQGLSAVTAWMEPREAAAACGQTAALLVLAMSRPTHSSSRQELARCLMAVLNRECRTRCQKRVYRFASAVALGLAPAPTLPTPAHLTLALDSLPEPLPGQTLVDLLKLPLCVGEARRVVLDALGRRYQRRFADQWDFVRFATEQKLDLDLSQSTRMESILTVPAS